MLDERNNFDKERMEASIQCCEVLKQYFRIYPYMRFNQVISNFQEIYKSDFYEEPQETLEKLKRFVK